VNELTNAIREALNASDPDPKGYPESGTLAKIDFVQGFELFGAYETWGRGWRVSGRSITVSDKDLDAAVAEWTALVWEAAYDGR
jgi:hypothetical protein